MKHSPRLAQLIDALRVLPGVGPKSAQRMAFQLLQEDRSKARSLLAALQAAIENVRRCRRCDICSSAQRDAGLLCIVESPADVVAIEQSGGYRGRYFVLMGHLSPLDGIGPEQLGVSQFENLLVGDEVRELILATNPTVEGEATAHFLGGLASRRGVKVSRIAHGVPVGGELEYVDGGTLAHALAGRQLFG
jgi:recombination protein RecR